MSQLYEALKRAEADRALDVDHSFYAWWGAYIGTEPHPMPKTCAKAAWIAAHEVFTLPPADTRSSDRVAALESRQNELGAALGRIESAISELRRACDNYTGCVLSPMLASLENRIMEQHNTLTTIIGMLERKPAKSRRRRRK